MAPKKKAPDVKALQQELIALQSEVQELKAASERDKKAPLALRA